ncbi:MAG TPA: hypothetical protein VJZ72_12200, partial [Candidatus Limnocylindrales bacterium]|nr:hypothetical protein [Candidatus Limnocylindrales bacterium]
GDAPLRKLFSKDQRAFFAAHAPAGIEIDALVPLGPIFVLKATFELDIPSTRGGLARRAVAEMWLYPGGERILELSTKAVRGVPGRRRDPRPSGRARGPDQRGPADEDPGRHGVLPLRAYGR